MSGDHPGRGRDPEPNRLRDGDLPTAVGQPARVGEHPVPRRATGSHAAELVVLGSLVEPGAWGIRVRDVIRQLRTLWIRANSSPSRAPSRVEEGHRQLRTLDQEIEGSNPSSPANPLNAVPAFVAWSPGSSAVLRFPSGRVPRVLRVATCRVGRGRWCSSAGHPRFSRRPC